MTCELFNADGCTEYKMVVLFSFPFCSYIIAI